MRLYSNGVYYHLTVHQQNKQYPNLILLHGFMGSQRVFRPLIKNLSAFCNPITIDLLGHGKTETKPEPERFKTENQAADLNSILSRLSLDNLYLCGYSMGGRLAIQTCISHPGYFEGVIIESAHCGISSAEEKLQRQRIDEERATAIETDFENFLTDWRDLPLFRHTPPVQKEDYYRIMADRDPLLMAASLRGFGAGVMPSVCSELENLPLPLLFIAGEYDGKYRNIMTHISARCNAEYSVIPRAGHRVHSDQPDLFVQKIHNFIMKQEY